MDAFEERAKHIGDHYDKNDSKIDDWVCVEENRPKGQIAPQDRQKAEQRSGVEGTAEEDSDLGESGIIEQEFPVAKRRRMVEDIDVGASFSMGWQ